MDASEYRKLFELASEFGLETLSVCPDGTMSATFFPRVAPVQPREKDPDAPRPRKSLMDAALEPVVDEVKRPGV